MPIKKKMEPKCNSFQMPDLYQEELSFFNAMYSLWSLPRNVNSNDQVVPPFCGFGVHDRLKNRVKEEYENTKLTYLPPTDASVTDFGTIYKLSEMLLLRSGKLNMPYVNLTLDTWVYVNAYWVLCNYSNKYLKDSLASWRFPFYEGIIYHARYSSERIWV